MTGPVCGLRLLLQEYHGHRMVGKYLAYGAILPHSSIAHQWVSRRTRKLDGRGPDPGVPRTLE